MIEDGAEMVSIIAVVWLNGVNCYSRAVEVFMDGRIANVKGQFIIGTRSIGNRNNAYYIVGINNVTW